MSKYHIYAYKHYYPAGGLDDYDIPMPYRKDEREYVIKANSEREAIKKAEKEYGSGERVDRKNNGYVKNEDGSWTLMEVTKVEL